MLGVKVRDRVTGQAFTVTGQYGGGWVLSPDDFGTPVRVNTAELRGSYDVRNVTEPTSADAQRGWNRISAVFRRALDAQAQGAKLKPRPTPEDVFAGQPAVPTPTIPPGQARAWAAAIAANPDELARFQIGLLDVPADVARLLDYQDFDDADA
jgi:hypothetical protein